MTSEPAPLAAVVLAHTSDDADAVQAAADAARDAGAQPVVAVLRKDSDTPAGVRVALVRDGALAITALRAGMALLTNTTARLVLLWPLDGYEPGDAARIGALVDTARSGGAAVTAFAHDDLDHSPLVVSRDAWLELVTIGEQGIGAVAARRGLVTVDAR